MTLRRALSRRTIALAGLLAICLSSWGATGSAGASPLASAPAASGAAATCLIHSLPAFVAQGEFSTTATVADVVEVECNPFVYGTDSTVTVTASQLYSRCGSALTWYVPNPYRVASGRSVELTLDADGSATVALVAGPHCQAGESLVTLHEDEAPFESFTTAFSVLPPNTTPQSVTVLPTEQVEDAQSSAVATIVEVEFENGSEKKVRLASNELYSRCRNSPGLIWVRENREVVTGPELVEENAVQLDDDGNGFAVAIGASSCSPGKSLIEADLERKPFTTLTTEFTILPPQPTAEPAFSIEKLQQIAGSSGGFTKMPLSGVVGQTIDYEIIVTNIGTVPEKLSKFTDARCDSGTIGGGPSMSPLVPGASTTFVCSHMLTSVGTYVNEATITGTSAGGNPLEMTSNSVEVKAESPGPTPSPGFSIEKLQELEGSGASFTSAPLTGTLGQTVDYEIIVDNTGNVPLKLSGFSDPHCDSGTTTGGPGETLLAPSATTTFRCKHLLTTSTAIVNIATVTGTPPGESPLSHESPPVEVKVASGEAVFTIEKLQRVAGSGASFTTAQLSVAPGLTVEYEIVVKNTGSMAMSFSSLTDPNCDPGTVTGGSGESSVAPGRSTTFLCTRALPGEGMFLNVATITGTGELPMTLESDVVKVLVSSIPQPLHPGGPTLSGPTSHPGNTGVLASCEVSRPKLHGLGGPESGKFTVWVKSAGIRQITFYLDRHKLKRLLLHASKKGRFSVRIDAHRLTSGVHRVAFKTVMSNPVCANVAATGAFVRPEARVAPNFTG